MTMWKAWYSNGRTFHSDNHRWQDLPQEECVGVVVIHNENYSDVIHQGDWYFYEDEAFHAVIGNSYDGTFVEKPQNIKCVSCIKKGYTIPDVEWERVHKDMVEFARINIKK